MRGASSIFSLLLMPSGVLGWSTIFTPENGVNLQQTRASFVKNIIVSSVVVGSATAGFQVQTAFSADDVAIPSKRSDPPGTVVNLPNGVSYTVIKSGKGPAPERGELAAIRFAAYVGETKIDDIFDTPEPYYTRIGSGGLLKGVEETLPLMQLGDRWKLIIPVSENFDCMNKIDWK